MQIQRVPRFMTADGKRPELPTIVASFFSNNNGEFDTVERLRSPSPKVIENGPGIKIS